jgi:hypothetical protein
VIGSILNRPRARARPRARRCKDGTTDGTYGNVCDLLVAVCPEREPDFFLTSTRQEVRIFLSWNTWCFHNLGATGDSYIISRAKVDLDDNLRRAPKEHDFTLAAEPETLTSGLRAGSPGFGIRADLSLPVPCRVRRITGKTYSASVPPSRNNAVKAENDQPPFTVHCSCTRPTSSPSWVTPPHPLVRLCCGRI